MPNRQARAALCALRSGEKSECGFTLVELMITVAVVAILAAVAVPSFSDAMLRSKLTSLANSFVSSANLARSEAIKRNAPVTLCASADGVSCSGGWGNGWVVREGATLIHTQGPLPNGFRLSGGDVTSIVFRPSGVGATLTNLTLCRATPSIGSQQRSISISATGRAAVQKVDGASTCA